MISVGAGSITVSSKKLVLGSASPRRLELLGVLGLCPDDIRKPDIDETPLRGEIPRLYCKRIALAKAQILPVANDEVLLCADTTVAVGRRILGKPADRAECEAFLRLLSGRRHRVISTVVVRTPNQIWTREVTSAVRMKRLGQVELQGYLDSNDWQGKAGGYGIQGLAGTFVPWISGSQAAIMGLPLYETAHMLQAAGVQIWKGNQR